jgi:hypothetical protein
MSTRATVRIDLVDGEQADLRLLLDRLRAEPELQVELQFGQGVSDVARTEAESGMLIAILDSAATASVFASVITAWLRRRRSGVIVRITVGDRTMELTSGTTAEEANRRLEPLVAARTTRAPGAIDLGARVAARRPAFGARVAGTDGLDRLTSTLPVSISICPKKESTSRSKRPSMTCSPPLACR